MFKINETKVIRIFTANLPVFGTVTDVYRGSRGHTLVECTTPEGWKFMSDPSHLEIIDGTASKEKARTLSHPENGSSKEAVSG